MLHIARDTQVPSVDTCINILNRHNREFGIPLDYDRMTEYLVYYTGRATRLRNSIASYLNISAYSLNDDVIVNFLKKNYGIYGLLPTAEGQISLGKESVAAAIATGKYDKEISTILQMYSDAAHYMHIVAPFVKILRNNEIETELSAEGHRFVRVHPTWVPQNTGRIGAQNPGIHNIAKILCDIETVPKGWVYITVDSGQVDPMITNSEYINDPQIKRCISLYGDAYFGYIHYCTILTDEDRISGRLDFEAVELSDEIKAKRKKFKTYGNAVMYGSESNPDNDPDKAAFIKYIGGNPKRRAWQADIERRVERGERTFYTAFGTPIDITKGPSEKNYKDKKSEAYFKHLVRNGINNPVQGSAADLMRLSIVAANNLLARKTEQSYILRYTHDSGTFAVHESELDTVLEDLRGITSYQVEGWLPIKCDEQIGWKQSGDLERMLK